MIAFLKQTFTTLRERRILLWAVVYYVGIWKGIEPLIALFSLTPGAVTIIRDLGVAFFPMVILLAWFHGEPGPQDITRAEKIILPAALLACLLAFYFLNKAAPAQYTVVMPLSQQDGEWFEQNILREFEKKHDVDIVLHTSEHNYERVALAALASRSDTSRLALVYVPLTQTGILLRDHADKLISFESVVENTPSLDRRNLASLLNALSKPAVNFGRRQRSDNKLFFLPAEYETPVLVYSQSKVENALRLWRNNRAALNAEFAVLTQALLPDDYALETEPAQWDYLDIFVLGSLFRDRVDSNHRSKGRLVYACSPATIFGSLMHSALAAGALPDDVFNLPAYRNGTVQQPIVEAFYWDAVFRAANVNYPGMWSQEGVSEQEVAHLLQAGEAFLAVLSNTRLARVLAANPDLRISALPAGASINGQRGVKAGFSNVWFWAIPKSSPSPEISYRLARWCLKKKHQALLAEKLLRMPVRQSLLQTGVSSATHSADVEDKVLAQIRINISSGPALNPYAKLNQAHHDILTRFYFDKWRTIVAENGCRTADGRVDRQAVKGRLMLP